MVYLPFSSVYTREGSIYAVQVPRDVQDVLGEAEFKEKDSHVGELQVSLDGHDMPDAAKDYGKKYPAFLCPHTGTSSPTTICIQTVQPPMHSHEFSVLCSDINCVVDGLLSFEFEELNQRQQEIFQSKLQELQESMAHFQAKLQV